MRWANDDADDTSGKKSGWRHERRLAHYAHRRRVVLRLRTSTTLRTLAVHHANLYPYQRNRVCRDWGGAARSIAPTGAKRLTRERSAAPRLDLPAGAWSAS